MNLTNPCVVLLALAMPAGCVATSRMGEAVVSERGGQPCFAASAPGAMDRLQAIIVSDVSALPATTIWASNVVDGAAASRVEGCIRYAPDAAGRGMVGALAQALQPGRIYHVFLNVRRQSATDPTQGYDAEFCVTGQAGGVHQIRWDAKLGRKSYAACGVDR